MIALLLEGAVIVKLRSLGAEAVPGVYTFIGSYNETASSVHGLHTPRFTLDESVLPRGAALHAALAFEFLAQHQSAGRDEL